MDPTKQYSEAHKNLITAASQFTHYFNEFRDGFGDGSALVEHRYKLIEAARAFVSAEEAMNALASNGSARGF